MANIKQTSDAKKGGLFVGKSHAEGGIPAIVTDTGQPIEVEGGEAIINKKATALHWEELSKINQSAGNGVPIPPPDEADKALEKFENGGQITNKEKQLVYNKWKKVVNMTYTELSRYYHSKDGKDSGLTESEAKEQGISSGRESAEWILKMKKTSYKAWTTEMWKWANKQISFISRMSGVKGDLTDEKGKKTRKYKALLIWGNNPLKKNAPKFETGGLAKKENCIDFIKNSEAIQNNGYFTDFQNLNVYVGAGDKIVPKEIKSIFLITFNSGGQKNLKPIDTINSLELANNLSKLLKIEIGIARIIVSEQTSNSKQFDINLINTISDKNIIIADRDNIVCTNISSDVSFETGGTTSPADAIKGLKALLPISSDTEKIEIEAQIKRLSEPQADKFEQGSKIPEKKSKSTPDDELIAIHNLWASNIIDAQKLGGLITPSIAILKPEMKFNQFGNITLICDKNLIDPALNKYGVKVFSGDVYSPTVPRKLYYFDKRKAENVTLELQNKSWKIVQEQDGNWARSLPNYLENKIGKYSNWFKNLGNSTSEFLFKNYYEDFKIFFLIDKDIPFKLPKKKVVSNMWNNMPFLLTEEEKKFAKKVYEQYRNNETNLTPETTEKFYQILVTSINNYLDKNYNSDLELKEYFRTAIFKNLTRYAEPDSISAYIIDNLAGYLYPKDELDDSELKNVVNKVVRFHKQEYDEWLKDFMDQWQGASYFEQGKEKMAWTLDNLVDVTSGKVRGQEKTMVYGLNKARSFAHKQFNSIADMKKSSNILEDTDKVFPITEEQREEFYKLSERIKYQYSSQWDKLSDLSKSLADYFKGTSMSSALRRNGFSATEYEVDLAKQFANELKNSPVDYFEAKMQRAVKLSEFKYAVVPKSKDSELDKAISILKENGIKVFKYSTDEERTELVAEITKKKKLRFEDGGNVEEAIDFYERTDSNGTKNRFSIEELDDDYKEVYQIRGFKKIGGDVFFFSRLNIHPLQNVFTIELPNGEEIGRATLNEKENYLINIRINENYRRKGLGLNLYNFIESVTSEKLKPSPDKISNEAKNLWIKRNSDIRFEDGGSIEKSNSDIYENNLLQIRVIGGANTYYRKVNKEWKFLSPEEVDNLQEGAKHEMEHSATIEAFRRKDIPIDIIASFIAYDHINEDYNYYKKLDKAIPEKMEQGKKISDKTYTYALTIRPFDIGTYPKQNFIRYVEEEEDNYKFGLLEYSEPLDDTAINHYSLAPVSELLEYDGVVFDYYDGNTGKAKIKRTNGNIPYVEVELYDKDIPNEISENYDLSGEEFLRNIKSRWKLIAETSIKENQEVNPETTNLSTSVESLSTPPQNSSTPVIEEIKEIPMEKEQDINSGSSVTNWNEVPVRWKNVKAIRPITFNLNPFDKGLNTIVKQFLGDDSLRPVMTTIHFADKGLVVTDAHKLLHIAYKHSDFKGNYATQNTLKAYKNSGFRGTEKITSIEEADKVVKQEKYPNWEAVIPRENPFVYEIDTMKLYQYTKVAINYANKTTTQVAYKFADGKAIGFNGKFLIETLEAMMKIQNCPKVYIHLSEPSRAGIISFEKNITPTGNTFALLMPVMVNREGKDLSLSQLLGAYDYDYGKSISCYFDFTDSQIHNANGTISEYKESYGDSQEMPLALITMLDKFIKSSKNYIEILNYVCVDGNGIRVSKLSDGMIEIANDWNIPQGLYTIQKNAFVKNTFGTDVSEFPRLVDRVSTKEPVFSMDTEAFKFYVLKASEHIGDDDLRPVMKSILFQKTLGTSDLEIVSTNAITLFHANVSKYAENVNADKFRFQIGNVKLLLNFIKNIETDKVHFYINETNYRIDAGRTHFESRLEDGKYPNWEAVTPHNFTNQLSFNIKDLLECVNNEASKMFVKEEELKKSNIIIYNQNDKIFLAKIPERNQEISVIKEVCEIAIKKTTFDATKVFNKSKENFILVMPMMFTNGNYFNFNLEALNSAISTIGKEKVLVDYTDLNRAYLFTSDNLDFKTSDVYKPIKTETKKVPTAKPIKQVVAKQIVSVSKPVAPKLTPEAIKVIPLHQLSVLRKNNFSEFEDNIVTLNNIVARVPKLYGQDSVKDKVVYLHYFYGNQDWYVTELDKSTGECFGYANLGYGAELGYMSIPEFVENGKVELDFYFEPKVWSKIDGEKETSFEKQNKSSKPKPAVPPTSKLTPEEESELLAEKWHKYLKENGVDEISKKLQKQLFDFNKKHFPVVIKLYVTEVGYGSDRSTKISGQIDFHKIFGWIDDKPFTKVVNGKIVNNDLGEKIGRRLSDGNGSASLNFTPTLENALIIQQEYEKNGYKTIIKNQLPVAKSKEERLLKNKQPIKNEELNQAIKGLEAFLRTSKFSAKNQAKTQVEQAIKGLKALLK